MNTEEIGIIATVPYVEILDGEIAVHAFNRKLNYYQLENLTEHKQILRVVYQLLEKEWIDKKLVMEFIKLTAEYHGITYRN
ncbi:hypothetical protein [Salinimonas iocasae]|uniref:Uncharacterized protein n=1 Tax=Salinimonas iocasae TaxID=2572577 RepID=A0A5B7YA48_9ALTE|nr:hypothetical protein [Salinimonas iocasae]QCZ92183.1 hypothetical protein FBQ74_01250 [Salinimonas iocasae]